MVEPPNRRTAIIPCWLQVIFFVLSNTIEIGGGFVTFTTLEPVQPL